MKIKNDIIARIFLVALLILCSVGNVYAARFEPAFEADFNGNSDNWYYIQFFNKGASGYMYSQTEGEHFKHSNNSVQNPAYFWQLIGDKDAGFVLVSMSGEYGYWNGEFLSGTTNASQAAQFHLIAGTDADSWAIEKHNASGTRNCLNPQGNNEIKTWSNDNGCRIRFYAPVSNDMDIAKETAFPDLGTLGNSVQLNFVDNHGNTLAEQVVVYTPESGVPVNLTMALSPYNFGGVEYHKNLFSVTEQSKSLSTSFDNDNQILTFTVTTDPNLIQFSAEPTGGQWAPGTRWFTLRNNRNNQAAQYCRTYISTSKDAVTEDCNLRPILTTMPADRGSYWCFTGDNTSGFYIQNAAYGPDFVLGMNGATVRMLPKDNIPSGFTTKFTAVDNSITDGATHAYAFRFGTSGGNHIHVTNGAFFTYNNVGAQSGGDTGSAFMLTFAGESEIGALPELHVYQVRWVGSSVSGSITYNDVSSKVFGRRGSANDGDYLILSADAPIEKANFNVSLSDSEYELETVTTKTASGHGYEILSLNIKDRMATEAWAVHVTEGYTVNHAGSPYENDDFFYVRPNEIPSHVSFTISGTDEKFVWGPVINRLSRSVTYEVRDLATALPSGWYQLQIADNEVAGLRDKIKPEEGNVNTKANTLYLASSIYEVGNSGGSARILKVTGVPQYAGEASTFVYIENNGSNSYSLMSATTGERLTGTFSFSNGRLTKTGGNWGYENLAYPLEGPFLLSSGSQNPSYKVHAANLSELTVYQVSIMDGDVTAPNVRLSISNNDVMGSKTIGHGGFIFMRRESNVPLRSQFSVISGNVSVENINIGAEANGVIPITINVTELRTWWKARIIGDAHQESDRIMFDGRGYANNELIHFAENYIPFALDFNTNVEDRFVWGPIIDTDRQEVTFDIRPRPADIETGWYQIQLLDEAKIASVNNRIASNAGNINTRSNYIYVLPLYNNTYSTLAKYGGIPDYADEAASYFYITRNGSVLNMQSPDGRYFQNGTAENGQATPQNISNWNYNDQKLRMGGWTAPGYWGSNGIGSIGNQGPNVAAGGAGTFYQEHYITKVDVADIYDVYQVSLPAGQNTVKYIGNGNHGSTEVYNNGYFFLTKGVVPTKDQFRFAGNVVVDDISISDSNVITFTITQPDYDHEIIHRQAKYYNMLETDANKPNHGFIKEGEGWSVRIGSNGETIREQNTAVFEIPIYLKQGDETAFESYLPTNELGAYQRWYDYGTDGMVDGSVLISPSRSSVAESNRYNNGHITTNQTIRPTFKLPEGMESYDVGLDISRLTDHENYTSGALTGCKLEPTLGMRIIYQVRDAKQMATLLKTKTAAGEFLEVHDIAFPNIKHGTYEDKTISNLLPLNLDLNNYWIFDGNGEENGNLLQLTEGGSVEMIVELASGSAPLRHVMKIPRNISQESGNINYSSFNTGHFILFQYPESGELPAGSKATINVYLQKNGGAQRYNLAKFNLSFIGNAEPIPVTELIGSYRHPDALESAFGSPVAELTFDNKSNEEYAGHYRYPLDFKGVSYAFGNMQGRSWFASRGEYALRHEANTTGGIVNNYFPVSNYLRNMSDANVSVSASKEPDSYFLYIDAADQPGKVASIELEDALCAGSRLYCYGYIGCTSGGTQFYGNTNQNPTSVLINVMGIDKNTEEEILIYSYCPGIISSRGYDKNGRKVFGAALGRGTAYEEHSGNTDYWALWQQIGFSFAISAEIASQMKGYSVQIVNNAWNSTGADTVLDDFGIYVKKPGAEVQNTTPLCSDQIRHIKVITEYETLLESTGEDSNNDGLMNVGFCFLDKEIFDQALIDYAGNIDMPRNNPENTYNKAFGLALMGNRTLDRNNKDHAFHNFNIIRDGAVSNIYGETKIHYYTDIPQYSFKESGDDIVYRDSIRGERYIVFKESVAHGGPSSLTSHKWTAGKSYYLLFSTATISEEHVNNHDLGCTVFNLDDNRCSVLYEFTVAPPVTIKGDATQIISGDEVQACAGQVTTLSVNLNGRTDSKDVIIKNLTYDWWTGYVSKKNLSLENGVPRVDSEGNPIYIDDTVFDYNTLPATMQNYMNVWYGTYLNNNVHLGKSAGDRIYLHDALLEFRRAYPYVSDLTGVVPKHSVGDTEEYELTQDMIDCIAHFIQAEPESGVTPLVLGKKELNLSLSVEKADKDKVVHFVVIPIAPGIYSVDEDAIYCPDPQELKVVLFDESPSLADGFNDMTYPEMMDNVPVRVGLQQINAVRKRAGNQRTLSVPVRKAKFAYATGRRLFKTSENAEFWIVGSDDPAYKMKDSYEQNFQDNYVSVDEDLDEMLITAGHVAKLDVIPGAGNQNMQLVFDNNVVFREGYTYTMKVKYYEVKDDNSRDMACEGSFVFDIKVVPEYQTWTGSVNDDWTNDQNWARADRMELHAGSYATGSKMPGATALDDATSYVSNETNTTASSFVPMYFTNVLLRQDAATAPVLYKGNDWRNAAAGTRFLEGLQPTATANIVYDMEVKPVNAAHRMDYVYDCDFDCELFGTYIAHGITFTTGAQMGNTHYLDYNKAWVEYQLDADRWYTIGSPLKNSFAGDWYSPTAGGKQLTPHFYGINYTESLNDRFRPAYYQRSWDRDGSNVIYMKSGATADSYVMADWSNVYNDAAVNYSAGGFSVKAELDYMKDSDRPADGKVLVRMPKADVSYTYYDVNGSTGQASDARVGDRTDSYRLFSDDLNADGSGTINMSVRNVTADNNFMLLSNPFMAAMDMDRFFDANTDLERKYWIVTADRQVVSVRSAADGEWITTGTGGGRYIAPLQGFFVKKTSGNSVVATYNAGMQTIAANVPVFTTRAASDYTTGIIRLTAERNGATSTAVIAVGNGFSDNYVAGEDCETFIDGNIYDKPTVYTLAGTMAQTINVRKTLDMVPVGMISSDNSDVTMHFDLSGYSDMEVYLYDAETDTFFAVTDGMELCVSGNGSGRYYITSSMQSDKADSISDCCQMGVWTPSGIYCGNSAEGLQPGLYIIDGVRMLIR